MQPLRCTAGDAQRSAAVFAHAGPEQLAALQCAAGDRDRLRLIQVDQTCAAWRPRGAEQLLRGKWRRHKWGERATPSVNGVQRKGRRCILWGSRVCVDGSVGLKAAIVPCIHSGGQRPTRTGRQRLVAQQLGHGAGGCIDVRQTGFQVVDEAKRSPAGIERAPIGAPDDMILNGRLERQGCPCRQGVEEADRRATCGAVDQQPLSVCRPAGGPELLRTPCFYYGWDQGLVVGGGAGCHQVEVSHAKDNRLSIGGKARSADEDAGEGIRAAVVDQGRPLELDHAVPAACVGLNKAVIGDIDQVARDGCDIEGCDRSTFVGELRHGGRVALHAHDLARGAIDVIERGGQGERCGRRGSLCRRRCGQCRCRRLRCRRRGKGGLCWLWRRRRCRRGFGTATGHKQHPCGDQAEQVEKRSVDHLLSLQKYG